MEGSYRAMAVTQLVYVPLLMYLIFGRHQEGECKPRRPLLHNVHDGISDWRDGAAATFEVQNHIFRQFPASDASELRMFKY